MSYNFLGSKQATLAVRAHIEKLTAERDALRKEVERVNAFRESQARRLHQLREECNEYRAALFHAWREI